MNNRVFETDQDLVAGLAEAVRTALRKEINPRVSLALERDDAAALRERLDDAGLVWTEPGPGHVELLIAPPDIEPALHSAARWFIVVSTNSPVEPTKAFDLIEALPEESGVWWFMTRAAWEVLGGPSRPLRRGSPGV